MPKRFRTRIVAIAAGVTLTLAGGGIAFAYWTSSGSGVGAATSGTSTAFTIAPGTRTGAPLTPGGAGQTLAFTVTNPGTGVQNLSTVTVAVADPAGALWDGPGDCSAADYTAMITTNPAPAAIAGGGSVNGTVTVSMVNDPARNQNACQGVTAPLYFTAA